MPVTQAEQPVRDHRRHVPGQEVVLAVLPPAADDVVRARRSSSSRGMSAGSFCRSPSDVTMNRPRAAANPAANAAVCPKLRVNRITRTCGSRAWISPQAARTSRRRCHRRPGSSRTAADIDARTAVSSSCRAGDVRFLVPERDDHGELHAHGVSAALVRASRLPGATSSTAATHDEADQPRARSTGRACASARGRRRRSRSPARRAPDTGRRARRAIAVTNCAGRTSATPAASTNSLNGAGGGSSAGTISASRPWRL